MERRVGTISRGIRCPIIRENDNLADIVIESVLAAAESAGKQQIDLIDGEEFITKLAEFGIGVREVKDYEIDEDFFSKI